VTSNKFIALYDAHYGEEYKSINGVEKKFFTENQKAIDAVLDFASEYDPDTVILGGDQLNCGPISHWNHGKPKLQEGFRLKAEMDRLDQKLLSFFDKGKPKNKIWLRGNHEQWIEDFVAANPGVQGLVEPENYLKLRERGWKIFSQGEFYKLGKLHFVHGDVILNGKNNVVNPAKYIVDQTRVSIRAGHIHTYYAYTDINGLDSSDYHTGIIVPCLCNLNPAYLKNRPTRFINGFLWGEVLNSGNFNDQVTIINDNKFVINGVIYG